MTRRALVPLLIALVAFAAVPSWAGAPAKKSLYERLGGVYAIATVVDDFIDRLVADPVLDANPAFHQSKSWIQVPGLKFRVISFLCHVAGGPEVYAGRNMKDSHAWLGISDREWDAMAKDLKVTLDKFRVPSAEQQELVAALGGLKGNIVGKK